MKIVKKHKIVFLAIFLFAFLTIASFTLALEVNYPRIPGAQAPQDFLTTASAEEIPGLYINYVLNLLIWLSGAIALVLLIYGGLLYLLSTGKPEAMVNARNQISASLLGLMILFSSFLILKTLNPEFTIFKTPKAEPIETVQTPKMSPPPGEEFKSSIYTEIPVGTIIEKKIFETKTPEGEIYKPRTERIREIAINTQSAAEKIETQSEELKNLSQQCGCGKANPVCPFCSGIVSITSVLGPAEMFNYSAITDNLSNVVGGTNNLFQPLTTLVNTADISKNITNFTSITGSLNSFTDIVPIADLTKTFGAVEKFADIIEFEYPEDLTKILNTTGDLTDIVNIPGDLTKVIEIGSEIAGDIDIPQEFAKKLRENEELQGIFKTEGDLNKVVEKLDDFTKTIKDPKELKGTLEIIGELTGEIKSTKDLKYAVSQVKNIAEQTGDLYDLNQVVKSVNDLTKITNIPENLMTESLNNIKEINTSMKKPKDLIAVFENTKTMTETISEPKDLIEGLEAFKKVVKDCSYNSTTDKYEETVNPERVAVFLEEALSPDEDEATFGIFAPPKTMAEKFKDPKKFAEAAKSIVKINPKVEDLNKIIESLKGLGKTIKTPEDIKKTAEYFKKITDIADSPQEITDILDLMGSFPDTIPMPKELTGAVEKIEEISKLTQNIGDFDKISESISDISEIFPDSENLAGAVEILEKTADITKDSEKLLNILENREDLLKLAGTSENVREIIGNMESITNIAKNQDDLSQVIKSINNLSKSVPIPENIGKTFDVLKDTASISKNPEELLNILKNGEDLAELVKTPENFKKIIDNVGNISNITGSFEGLSKTFDSVGGLAKIAGTHENLTSMLAGAENLGSIGNIVGNYGNLTNVMDSMGNFSNLVSDITNPIANVQALGQLLKTPENVLNVFGGRSCDCDPCANRSGITQKMQENLNDLSNLIKEQAKAEQEIRLLKEEIGKIERAEKFMSECPQYQLNSLAQFLSVQDNYLKQDLLISVIKFWDEIKDVVRDNEWASFYCPVSGTLWEGKTLTVSPEDIGNLTYQELPETEENILPCTQEIPVGEIIDRTKRIGKKLTERLEKLISLNEEFISVANELHTAVSQCTSQAPRCHSICICIPCPHGAGCCPCIQQCVGSPCPSSKINNKIRKMQQIIEKVEGIKEVVSAPKRTELEKKENIGITTIIDIIVPNLLKDLAITIRSPMKSCVNESLEESGISEEISARELFSCNSAIGAAGPDGKLIKKCCYEESFFEECLQECYMEGGGENYKKCLQQCLNKKSEKLEEFDETKQIPTCRHLFNFYCCSL